MIDYEICTNSHIAPITSMPGLQELVGRNFLITVLCDNFLYASNQRKFIVLGLGISSSFDFRTIVSVITSLGFLFVFKC